MTRAILILSAAFLLWLVYLLGPTAGAISFTVIAVLVLILRRRVIYLMTLSEYRKRIENIYVVSRHPSTGEWLEFGSDLDNLITWVKYPHVVEQAEKQKEWLALAGNEHFTDEVLSEGQRLQVRTIIYQDGKHVNETWEQFGKRVKAEVQADRQERHSVLKDADSSWYDKYGNHQNGIDWGI